MMYTKYSCAFISSPERHKLSLIPQKHIVILSGVAVRLANGNAVEGPHEKRVVSVLQGVLPVLPWLKYPSTFMLAHTGMGSFDSATRFAKRIVLLRSG